MNRPNIWAEIDALPRHHRLAIAGEIIKRDNPTEGELSVAAGMARNALGARRRRAIKSRSKS